jgi:Spy/CpxP family protein refolding chaperone
MKIRTLLLSTLIASSLGLGSMAYANPDMNQGYGQSSAKQAGGMRNKSPEQRMERMAKRLGLSESQQQQFSALMQTKQASMSALRSQTKNLRQSMHSLDPSAADYNAQLSNLADQSANLARQMMLEKGQNKQKIFNLLTPEQQTKMKVMQAKRMNKRAERQ